MANPVVSTSFGGAAAGTTSVGASGGSNVPAATGVLVLFGRNNAASTNTNAVIDNAGTTYQKIGSVGTPVGGYVMELWYGQTQRTVPSLTVTCSIGGSNSNLAVVANILSGLMAIVDNAGQGQNGQSVAPNANGVASIANETAILGVIYDSGGGSNTPAGGDSLLTSIGASGFILASFQQQIGPGTANVSIRIQNTVAWGAFAPTFVFSSSSGGGGSGGGSAPTPPPPTNPNLTSPTITPTPGLPSSPGQRICVTRAIKNARFIQKKAALLTAALAANPNDPQLGLAAAGFPTFNPAFVIPTVEPANGYFSIIPPNILNQIEPINGIGAGFFHTDQSGNLVPDVQNGQNFGPVFNGTVLFVAVSFVTPGGAIALSAADLQTAVSFLTLAATSVAQYAQQYGSAGIIVNPVVIPFVVTLGGTSFNDQSIGGVPSGATGWADLIAAANGLTSNGTSNCLIFLVPGGVLNTDANPAQGYLGYHNLSQGNMPYIFVNVTGSGLTIADPTDSYALALAHELAEMTVDPFANLSNPEVCDPCGPNCQTVWRDYFDANNNYLLTSVAFPPGIPYAYFLNGIVTPSASSQCPAPPNACAYGPPQQQQGAVPTPVNTNPNVIVSDVSSILGSPAGPSPSIAKVTAMKQTQLVSPLGITLPIVKLPLGS